MSNENEFEKRRAKGTAHLLEQVARRMHEKRYQKDLHAAQWAALRYFERSGRQTATVIGLSRYLGNTSGSTSRTARSLVDRNLLVVTPSKEDARSVTFTLTAEGHEMLKADPLHEVMEILTNLPPAELGPLSQALDMIQTDLHKRRACSDKKCK
ncbi:MAG: MarR family transcriptional regulator [Pseudomonadota bacterium]